MKKYLLLIFIGLQFACSGSRKTNSNSPEYDFTDKLDQEDLAYLKEVYHWKEEKVLIINFIQPESSCHFDNHKITPSGKAWWKNFYSQMNTENCLNIHVYANGKRVIGKLDGQKYFDDRDGFLLDNFFRRKRSCYGVMVVNDEGKYLQFNGHYSEGLVENYIQLLKS